MLLRREAAGTSASMTAGGTRRCWAGSAEVVLRCSPSATYKSGVGIEGERINKYIKHTCHRREEKPASDLERSSVLYRLSAIRVVRCNTGVIRKTVVGVCTKEPVLRPWRTHCSLALHLKEKFSVRCGTLWLLIYLYIFLSWISCSVVSPSSFFLFVAFFFSSIALLLYLQSAAQPLTHFAFIFFSCRITVKICTMRQTYKVTKENKEYW